MNENIEEWGSLGDALDARTAPAPDPTLTIEDAPTEFERSIERDAATELDLRPVLDGIRDLRDSLVSYQSLEHTLVELCQTTEFHQSSQTQTLVEIRNELAALRAGLATPGASTGVTGETGTTASAPTITGTDSSQIWRVGRAEVARLQRSSMQTLSLILVTLSVFAWSICGYLKTGSVWHAVVALGILNAVGVYFVLRRRK